MRIVLKKKQFRAKISCFLGANSIY